MGQPNSTSKMIMATDKQTNANRENAKRSTGPRTPDGKARIRYNAMSHGLLAEAALLPDEDEPTFRAFEDGLKNALSPVGAVESLLVERIINLSWRLRRASQVETGLFVFEQAVNAEERYRADARAMEIHREEFERELSILTTCEPLRILNEEMHQEACVHAEQAAAVLRTPLAELAATFVRDAATNNAFSKLSRYETTHSRDLERAMKQLSELQEARQA
jgi:hypothetical protein